MKSTSIIMIRRFSCPVCGQKMTACKCHNATSNGHVKTMYCPGCKKDQNFIQYDIERVRA